MVKASQLTQLRIAILNRFNPALALNPSRKLSFIVRAPFTLIHVQDQGCQLRNPMPVSQAGPVTRVVYTYLLFVSSTEALIESTVFAVWIARASSKSRRRCANTEM